MRGMAYDVQGEEHEGKLTRYETDCYRTLQVIISVSLQKGKGLGTPIVWNRESYELNDGAFDVES